MQLSEMRTLLQEYLGNRPEVTNAVADAAINQQYLELSAEFRFHEQDESETITTVIGTEKYQLQPGVTAVKSVRDVTSAYTLRKIDPEIYDKMYDSDVTGPPVECMIWQDYLYLTPVPDAEYELLVREELEPVELVKDTDVPLSPTRWHIIYVLLGAADVAFRYDTVERARFLKNEGLSKLSSMQEGAHKEHRNMIGTVSVRRTRTRL